MGIPQAIVINASQLPGDPQWLGRQPCPVIAYGSAQPLANADVVVPDFAAAQALEQRVNTWPMAALTLVQVLRSTPLLPLAQALDVESLAYATLQSGQEFLAWRAANPAQNVAPGHDDDAVVLSRDGNLVEAELNRPELRNSMTVEMREAWIDALNLLDADDAIEQLRFRGRGDCFSVGGELHEFGTRPNPATAHWVRTVHSPARLLARLADRVTFYLHGACLGSGIELPAFAARVVAHSRTFFQLPELQFGLIPGAGGTVSMTRRIGRQRVCWLVLSGRRINARTALEWGLIDAIADEF